MKKIGNTEKRLFIRQIFLITVFMIFLCTVFFIMYCIVYERCYNVMNEDKMITLRFFRWGEDIVVIFFNKMYRLKF